jgi:hypothetical protein
VAAFNSVDSLGGDDAGVLLAVVAASSSMKSKKIRIKFEKIRIKFEKIRIFSWNRIHAFARAAAKATAKFGSGFAGQIGFVARHQTRHATTIQVNSCQCCRAHQSVSHR